MPKPLLSRLRLLALALLALSLSACALLPSHDPLEVQVAGIQPLPGEGLELRLLRLFRNWRQ